MAWIVDIALFWAASFVFGIVLATVILFLGQDPQATMDALYWPMVIGLTALFICKDGFYGYSLGKMLCGVRVYEEATGEPIGFGASFKRNLPSAIPFVPLVIAYQLMKGKRAGDGWAGTKVVWMRYADSPVFAVGARAEAPADGFAPVMPTEAPVETNNPYQAPRG